MTSDGLACRLVEMSEQLGLIFVRNGVPLISEGECFLRQGKVLDASSWSFSDREVAVYQPLGEYFRSCRKH